MAKKRFNPQERRRAREMAVQALYQWQMTHESPTEIEVQFHQEQEMVQVDTGYFSELLQGVTKEQPSLDKIIVPALDRELTDLNPVELAILRLAAYELTHMEDIPFKVVVNEATELAKTFGATDGYKYVNAVVDKIAKSPRS